MRLLPALRVLTMLAALAAPLAHAQGSPPAAPASTARPITLAEALALAQDNAPAIVQARGQVRTTSAGVRTAYGSFLPTFSLNAGASRQLPAQGAQTRIDQNGQVVILPPNPYSYNAGLSANVLLFDGGGRFFDLRQAKARASAAQANETAQEFNLVLAVKEQFFNVLAERETEAAARAQLEQADQQRTVAVARVRSRVATRSDSLRAEIQVRTAKLAVSDAINAIAVAEAGLTRLVGSADLVTASPSDTLDEPALTVSDEELRTMAAQSPAVVQAERALEAAKAARKSTWTDYLPAISLGYSRAGSATSESFAMTGADYKYSGSMRLSVSLPVFTQFTREAQVTQAQVAEDNAVAALRDARLAADEGLTQSLAALRSAEERLESQVATVEASDEDLRVQRQRYAVGGSTLLDVLASQTQLDQARRDLIRARYDRRVARAQLEALVGRDL
jgi:outer membrane protein